MCVVYAYIVCPYTVCPSVVCLYAVCPYHARCSKAALHDGDASGIGFTVHCIE